MKDSPRPAVTTYPLDRAAHEAAIRKAVREAVLAHARAGNPVATWRDGKVVWIQPEEILANPYFQGHD